MMRRLFAMVLLVAMLLSLAVSAGSSEGGDFSTGTFGEGIRRGRGQWAGFRSAVFDQNTNQQISNSSSDEDIVAAYNDYVDVVSDVVGTTTIGKDGFYFPLVQKNESPDGFSNVAFPAWSYRVVSVGPNSNQPYFDFQDFIFKPTYPCSVSLFYEIYGVNVSIKSPDPIYANEHLLKYINLGGTSVTIPNYGTTPISPGWSVVPNRWGRFFVVDQPPSGFFTIYYRFALYVEPYDYSPNDYTASVGGSDARAGNIPMDVGFTVGDDLIVAPGSLIVDEAQNLYYNPVTDQSYNVQNWHYDYGQRSYTITTDQSETVTVTYGDQHITINEGGTTYNIQYVYPSDSGGDGGDDDNGGSSGGGFFEWIMDKLGAIGGTLLGGVVKLLKSALEPLFDGVISLLEMVVDKLGGIVSAILNIFSVLPSMFSGFTAFLAAFFSFLPPGALIFIDVLIVGIALVIIVSLIKLLRG